MDDKPFKFISNQREFDGTKLKFHKLNLENGYYRRYILQAKCWAWVSVILLIYALLTPTLHDLLIFLYERWQLDNSNPGKHIQDGEFWYTLWDGTIAITGYLAGGCFVFTFVKTLQRLTWAFWSKTNIHKMYSEEWEALQKL